MDLYHEILSRYWGFDRFRPLQEDIIRSVAAGRDTLGLMPTGGGKSVTFQVYSLSTEGMCLVITPLIALINDQVDNLRSKGIRALAIYSGMTSREIDTACSNALYGDYKFLYISPERLVSPAFREYLVRFRLNLIAVDEAHCISQWGYDFRPSYLRIAEVRSIFPETPLLALTATATPQVVDDIQDKLLFRERNLLKKSFYRENLAYLVRNKEDKTGYILDTVSKAAGSGIVYVRSRKKCREISDLLRKKGVTSDYYHAGLDGMTRREKQNSWMNGETRVMVATNAFGMGIDKPDVRFVLHPDLPDSLEAYFQEAGRAGRDGRRSAALMLYNGTDRRRLHKMVTDAFPPQEVIRQVYHALCDYLQVAVGTGQHRSFAFHPEDFARTFHFSQTTVFHSLKLLEREGYLEYTDDPDTSSRLCFLGGRDELYRIETGQEQEELISTLLRSYSGLFSDYARIDESLLARRLNLNRDQVYQKLVFLSQRKIVHYIPGRNEPLVQLLTERIDAARIRFSKENYEDRKQVYQRRVDAVIRYAESDKQCRSVLLLRYFGEDVAEMCGQCDVCKGEHLSGLSNSDYDRISKKIVLALAAGPVKPHEMSVLDGEEGTTVLKVVRYMLDQQLLKMDASGRLTS